MADRQGSWPSLALLALGVAAAAALARRGQGHGNGGARGYAEGRGRSAASPHEIPVQGWKDIGWRVYQGLNEDRVLLVAAGVTFYALLALFPAITALVSLYGLFADPAVIDEQVQRLSGVLPGGAIEVIGDQVRRITARGNATLSVTFLAGLAVALWSANAGMKSLIDALNIVYDEREKRGFLLLNVESLLFTIAGLVVVMLALGAIVVVPVILNLIGLGGWGETLLRFMRWPLLLLLVLLGLAALYRFAPSRERPQWRWVTWGSGLAALAWLTASMLFSWYVSNFGSYNETYGSLGAAIGFMVWIWITAIIVLIGAEINAELEHQTARDTTTGAPQALGVRGATMADTLGAARS